MKQKILAIFLSVVMLLGMLPASIIAGATDGETTESTLPAGTVGYVMDVPETEQYISHKVNGISRFGYTQWLLMRQNANTAADPFSDSLTDADYYGDHDNGGAYVKVFDGEEFFVLNPYETVVTDYKTTSEIVTTETTAEDGTVTKKDETVVTGTTELSKNSGQRNRFIGQIWYNGISSIENSSITSNVTGLPLVDDADESSITHIAFRIKVVGGHKDQISGLQTPSTTGGLDLDNYCGSIYYVDAKTGAVANNAASDIIILPYGDFDGYMVIPVDVTTLSDSYRINFYSFAESSDWWKTSDWTGRSLCMGDAYAVTDSDAFKAQFVPENAVTPEAVKSDKYSYKGADGVYYMMNVYDDVNANPFIANNASLSPSGKSETGGANNRLFKDADGNYTSSSTTGRLNIVEIDGETFIEFDRNEDVDLLACANTTISFRNITYDGTGTAGLHSSIDKTNLNYFALRVKIDELEGAENTTSGFYLYMWHNLKAAGIENSDESNAQKLKTAGTYYVDLYGNMTKYTASESTYYFTGEFDGWVVVPFSAYDITFSSSTGNSYTGKDIITNLATSIHPYFHGEDCHWQTKDGWDNKLLYFGDMVVFEDTADFLCSIGAHELGEAVEAVAPSTGNAGKMTHYACANCARTFADAEGVTEVNPEYLAFDAASLTLEQNIAVNFKANEANLAGYTDVYAKFTFNGNEQIVKADKAVNGKYVFTFDNIGPQLLGKTIKAQLFGKYNGTEYSGTEIEYSVKDYCYNMLAEYEDKSGDKAQAFRTLLVDLLNYGSKAQLYTQTDMMDMVNENLGHIGSINRTIAAKDITTGTRGIIEDTNVTEKLATWKGVNLYFEETTGLMFRFATDSVAGVTVRVTDADGNLIEEIEHFTDGASGSYIAYFDGLSAAEMRKTVYVSVYKNGEKISDTLAYDVVSYVKQTVTKSYVSKRVTTKYDAEGNTISGPSTGWPSDPNKNLKILVSFMMRYGDSVAAYAALNA